MMSLASKWSFAGPFNLLDPITRIHTNRQKHNFKIMHEMIQPWLPIVFYNCHGNYVSTLHRFRDIDTYWWKTGNVSKRRPFPDEMSDSSSKFQEDVWRQKTRSMWLLKECENHLMIMLTDKQEAQLSQTDRESRDTSRNWIFAKSLKVT